MSAAGVFVVDTKHYKGLVHTRRSGPIVALGPDELHVGRRGTCRLTWPRWPTRWRRSRRHGDRHPRRFGRSPPRPVLCLTRAAWGFASAIEIGGVCVAWPQHVAGQVQAPGDMDSETVRRISAVLAARLPMAH